MANSVDLDEVAHNEPPHQDLRCMQIQLFSSLVVKELNHGLSACMRRYSQAFVSGVSQTVVQVWP